MSEEKIKTIKLQLIQYQTQIKVLVHNHKILKEREAQTSQDCQPQIKQIEQYLVKLSQKQSKLIVKLKRFENVDKPKISQTSTNDNKIKAPHQNQNDATDIEKENISNQGTKVPTEPITKVPHDEANNVDMDDDASNVENIDNASSSSQGEITRENSIEKDDIGTSSPEEINEDDKIPKGVKVDKSRCKNDLKSLRRSNMEPPDSSKMSVKDRMAIVRGMRRYGKRRGGGGKPYHSNRGSRKASPSPTEMLFKHGDQLSEETEEDLFDYMTNGQYRGHVSEIEKLRLDKDMLDERIQSSKEAKIDDKFYPKEMLYPSSENVQYMLNLGLVTSESIDEIYKQQENIRVKTRDVRNLTYVAEIRDKKLRVGYSYLAPDVTSPPMLRARQGNPATEGVRKSSRSKRILIEEEFVSEELS